MRKLFIIFVLIFTSQLSAYSSSESLVVSKFKQDLTQFMQQREFRGATVSITKGNRLIANEALGEGVHIKQAYPIASISKVFTEMAIRHLIKEGVISLNTKVFSYLNLSTKLADPRVKQITVKHLLDHKGGWDRDFSMDPQFALDSLFPNKNRENISKDFFLKYVLRNVILDHNPGEVHAYSNFGYFLLGAVIEKASGKSYLDYINTTFAAPLHITLHQAKTPDHFARETPYNKGFCLELSTASFGLAVKGEDIVRFFATYQRDGTAKKTGDGSNRRWWWHDGSLPASTSTLVYQGRNNVVIYVMIPDRDEEHWIEDDGILKDLVAEAAEKLG